MIVQEWLKSIEGEQAKKKPASKLAK